MNGINNVGNTCFMNSILQLLLSCDDFKKIIKKYSKSSSEINIVSDFIKEYENDSKSIRPIELKKMISQNINLFDNYNQHDAFEFLVLFLDFLNSKCNNEFNNIFNIKTNINIKCKVISCFNESIHSEKDIYLMLPILNTLDESYREYKSTERIDRDLIYCEKCRMKTVSRKMIKIEEWPNNLIIVLKRFYNNLRKNTKDIEIPFKWRHNYKLYGGVIHSGSSSGGHYYYYRLIDNDWYVLNDSGYRIINTNELINLKKQSYILYFKKV